MPRATIIGAGLAGLTAAVILRDRGYHVNVYERKSYVGGTCVDFNYKGRLVHKFGPHVFHTDDKEVYDFISRFSAIVPYKHEVVASTDKMPDVGLPIPYNQLTEKMIGRRLSDEEIIEWFFKPYTTKMWGIPWDELPDTIKNRVPKRRDNDDCGYFTDKYQGLPELGYFTLFNQMADYVRQDPESSILCDTYDDNWKDNNDDLLVYTGSIDELANFRYGQLEYKSLTFSLREASHLEDLPAAQNECNTLVDYTRVSNYDRLTLNPRLEADMSPVITECPVRGTVNIQDGGCFYPLPWWKDNGKLYDSYKELLLSLPHNVVACGRLGSYKYMNMDVTIRDVMNKLSAA